MKLMNLHNVEGFFNEIEKCKGDVYLITDEGDRINLKSSLCKYIAFAKLYSEEASITNAEILFSEPEDATQMLKFLVAS